ncbi:ATP-dependent helicase [Candidatus Saccharibacteria bacterium]|nr:ATP-dependent helicase [Candidatus Saccharibacteria bacterium]
MEREYRRAFASLNKEQKKAVEAIEGPVLVIAGPGTGKTQLLSTRVANILDKADVSPGNVLCLTFTDNAARNMRERLGEIIGRQAYHVAIHTFHSFGVDIINQYPDLFNNRQLLQQVDELGRYQLLAEIFEGLPHSNPLSTKVGDNYIFIKDALDAIGWLKQNAVTPAELHLLLNANKKAIDALSPSLAETFEQSPLAKHLPKYEKLLKNVQKLATGKLILGFPGFADECAAELSAAIKQTDTGGRYATKITEWRNDWCQKDASGKYVFKDGGQNYRKMHALANVYQELLDSMSRQGLYDFEDMVMESVHAIENSDELRFNLQERYQYILVDEFQDTNKAQLRMLTALGDNPVHEGRPNIMAVGDDDQAIYAFQGAEASNMVAFARIYGTEPIVLNDNYRSDDGILKAAEAVAGQISDRLDSVVPGATKRLVAKRQFKSKTIDYRSFSSELAQYSWIAEEVEKLLKSGTEPEEIAIVAPRHRYLERLMPYLGEKHVPVAYERRENILDAPIIVELTSMAELVVALSDNRQEEADALFGQVLGYGFWGLPTEVLIDISLECHKKHRRWLDVLNKHKSAKIRVITAWFVDLAKRSRLEPMEYMLDRLVGGTISGTDSEFDQIELPAEKKTKFTSPFKEFYFDAQRYEQATESYLTLLGQLSTLRHHLRQWQPNKTLRIQDLTQFIQLNQDAGLRIVDTNPHTQTTNAVQVMTVYKAKGLEFEAVFAINAQDEVWGPTARSRTSRISLPHNLPIAPAGDSDNDKLRLLFVALTRAKHTLHICGYSHDLDNKLSPALSFLDGISRLALEEVSQPTSVKAAEILSTDWSYRFRQIIADKPALMAPILDDYKLSVTHLNNFLNVADGGPYFFLMHNLLRFPAALTPSAAYGDSVHQTLKWLHGELHQNGRLPSTSAVNNYFEDMLKRKHLKKTDYNRLCNRGRDALSRYLKEKGGIFEQKDLAERGFNNDGVVIGEARLSGKIDIIHFKDAGRTEVIDFKTGKPVASWQGKDEFEKIKLHKYRQQLLFYKILLENSASYQGKSVVDKGRIEFIEADANEKFLPGLELAYEQDELRRFTLLVNAVWQRIMKLDFPDTSKYAPTIKGIVAFEEDLIG